MWPFHYGASLTSSVWAPVWQALLWAATDPLLVDHALIQLGILRIGFTALQHLRSDWQSRQVNGPRDALRYLRKQSSQEPHDPVLLLGAVPRRHLDMLVACYTPLLVVDCLAGWDGPHLHGLPDAFFGSPVDLPCEDIEALTPDWEVDQRPQTHPGQRELKAARALSQQASTPDPQADAGAWIQANGWLFLPVFARRVLAPTLVALRTNHQVAWTLTMWLASRGLHHLSDLWGACWLPELDAESPLVLPPIPDGVWTAWRREMPPATYDELVTAISKSILA